MMAEKGLIFNIQKYCVHDGPGIRSIVFLKGCPLSCQWCSNPEGMASAPELSYKASSCITLSACGYCQKACPAQAITASDGGAAQIDRGLCSRCMACAEACPAQAIEQIGRWMSIAEVLEDILSDAAFYARSGGGITLSGGEPLRQWAFARELLLAAKENGLETAIETTGHAPWDKARLVFAELDFIHMDLKSCSDEKHRAFTGVTNQLILDNFAKLCQEFPHKPIIVRTPVIPGFNDTIEDIQAIADYISAVGGQVDHLRYELLPFHNFGEAKYAFQGKPYAFTQQKNMDAACISALKEQLKTDITLI